VTANVMVVVEGSSTTPVRRWHVEAETVTSELKPGGRHHHVKIRDNDPSTRVTTDAVFTEFFDPDVFVARQRITGDPGIDPDTPLELRVEFTKMGRNGTLLRVVQGPFEADVAGFHSKGWELELGRLEDYLARSSTPEVSR
jgi:Activator of Hsp90 ATPase homolog 1-like protein